MPKPLKFALVAAVLLLLGISAQGTAATWRAEITVDPPSLRTGSLALLAGGETEHQFANLSGSELIPGAFTQASLVISNAGTVDLSYQLDGAVNATTSPTVADRALSSALQLSIYSGMDRKACDDDQPLSGEQLYTGSLGASASFAAPRVLRAEPAMATETLCVRVSLPSGAPEAASGGKMALELGFAGQQR